MFKGLEVMDKSWFNAMKSEMDKEYFQKLSKFVSQKRDAETVYPTVQNVFRWTSKSLSRIKVSSEFLWPIKYGFILGGYPWTGSISRTEPSSWIIVFCSATNSTTTKFEKHVQRTYSRWKCSVIYTSSKSRRSQFMGRPRCTHAQCSFDRFSFFSIWSLCLNNFLVTKSKANSHKGQGWEKFTDSGRFLKFSQLFFKKYHRTIS